jgi:hypothetical protein
LATLNVSKLMVPFRKMFEIRQGILIKGKA